MNAPFRFLRRWAETAKGRRLHVILLPLPLAVPLALVWWGRFDGLYGQDPFAYYDYATGPLLASLRSLQLPPPFFWPPGYPLLAALTSLWLGVTPLAGQLVSLAAGMLVPIFTALLAYELWSGPAGSWRVPLLGGLLAALTGQLWQSSIVVMADTTALAAATAGVWSLARYGNRPHQGGWLALAAAAIAFAVLTRCGYALVAILAVIVALWVLRNLPRSLALRQAFAAALAVAMILLPVWLPYLAAAMDSASRQPAFVGDLKVYSWNPANAFRRQFVTADGLLVYRWPNGLWYGLAPAHRFYFTPLLAVFLPLGVWAVVRRSTAAFRQSRAWSQQTMTGVVRPQVVGPSRQSLAVLLLIGWPLMVFAFHAGAPWQNFRFNLAHLPPLAILVAIGIDVVAGWLGRRVAGGVWRVIGRGLLAGLVLAGMVTMSHGGLTLTREFIARKSADLATVRWVETQTELDATLLTFNLTSTFKHYSRLQTHDLFNLDSDDLSALLDDGGPVYLLANLAEIEGQWQGRPPSLNYRWLQDEAGLIDLGKHRSYTLFRVQDRSGA